MGPAGKSFLMAQLWGKPAQHVQCRRPPDFSWIQIVKKSPCFIWEQVWWIPAWNHREQICSENNTERDWSRIQSWGVQQKTSGENQLQQHWKQPWEPREASRSWLPPWPSGFVHFSYFRRGIHMTPPKLKRCENNEEENREISALLRMFHWFFFSGCFLFGFCSLMFGNCLHLWCSWCTDNAFTTATRN